jgi:Tol biopolymer transport system component
VRRLTLDDRDDVPSCWMPDGSEVVFESTRYGNKDLFVQGLDERNARDLAVGAGEQSDPQLTPDAEFLLYWESDQVGMDPWNHPRRLYRIPVTGGPTELVLETELVSAVQCATAPEVGCLLTEYDSQEKIVTLSRLDPLAGRGEEIVQTPIALPGNPKALALSPDGSLFAMAFPPGLILLWDTTTGIPRPSVQLEGLPGVSVLTGQAWSLDGQGLYVTGFGAWGQAVFYVNLRGESRLLYEVAEGVGLSTPRLSPDGRHLAFGQVTQGGNVWIVEGL